MLTDYKQVHGQLRDYDWDTPRQRSIRGLVLRTRLFVRFHRRC